MRLLIHHHAVAFVDTDGGICLPAFIARWVDALSTHFNEIGLLLHQSQQLTAFQDEKVLRSNVYLISLGEPGRTWDHFSRIRRIRRVCQSETIRDDILLVRGVTPRQSVVWNAVKAKRKVFLLVGIPTPLPLAQVRTLDNLWTFVMSRKRIYQLRRIFLDAIVLVNAPNLVPLLATQFGIQADFVPTNSIRLSEFVPLKDIISRKLGEPLRLLFCGRVTYSKGIVEILSALFLLRKSGLECVLDVVGSAGEGDQLKTFQLMAQKLGVSEWVNWHGQISYGLRLFEYYQSADILLLPSYTEGFPHVLWEAAANGCSIITSPVGGIPSLIANYEHAIFVSPRNARALSDAISFLSQNKDLRKKIVVSAHILAREYAVESCAYQLADRLGRI